MAKNYAVFCELAAPFGLSADIEFMPWTAIKCLTDATALLHAAGRPANAEIWVDAIHYARSNISLAHITQTPHEWWHYAQICDALGMPETMDEILHQARNQRLMPGEGTIDLRDNLQALPNQLPLSIEVWDERRAPAMGLELWAKMALQAVKTLGST